MNPRQAEPSRTTVTPEGSAADSKRSQRNFRTSRQVDSVYRAVGRSQGLKGDPDQRNSTSAFDKVIQTPQAIGMPTASHAKIEVASRRHSPMPIDPLIAPAACDCACSAAISSSFMNHLLASGLIK